MKEGVAIGGNVFTYVLTIVQTNEIFQIISLVLSIITSLIIIAYRLYVWYKAAKADGKITKDELEDAAKIVVDGAKEIDEAMKEGDQEDAQD